MIGRVEGPATLPSLPRDAHKGIAGRVLSVCGHRAMPGAALLVASACQRAGAGLVTAVTGSDLLDTVLMSHAPECVLMPVGEDALSAESRSVLVQPATHHACVAGPGRGVGAQTRELMELLVTGPAERPLVVDADGLNVFAGKAERLRQFGGTLVITPHVGEARRLLGREISGGGEQRVEAARELAERTHSICCLKGQRTVVTDGKRVYVNPTGNPGLATAGTGDVLAGIAGAYLAQTSSLGDPAFGPLEAVVLAVYVHGLAADLAIKDVGERGLVASDLISALPRAQRRVELNPSV